MTKNTKTQKMQTSVFVQNHKKKKMEIFAFCVITFEPIKIKTCFECLAPQNDCLKISFVKAIYVVFEKMARNGLKTAIYQSQIGCITLQFSSCRTCQAVLLFSH